jgi:hypothetical protein
VRNADIQYYRDHYADDGSGCSTAILISVQGERPSPEKIEQMGGTAGTRGGP